MYNNIHHDNDRDRDSNTRDMELHDNEIQKITNCMLYSHLVNCIACLLDEATDEPVCRLLAQYSLTFGDIHSTRQSSHIWRVTGIYYAMVMNRTERLMRDALFVALLEKYHPQRKKYVNESLERYEALRKQHMLMHQQNQQYNQHMVDWTEINIVAPNIASIVVALSTKHHFAHPEVARFIRLCRLVVPIRQL